MEEQNLHNELFGDEQQSGLPIIPVKRLERSADDNIITGVCGGIAKYFGKDPATIRVITMMLLLLGGWIVAAYLIIAFLLPFGKPDELLTEEKIKATKKENFKTLLSGLFILTGLYYSFVKIGLANSSGIFILPNSFMFPLLAIAAGVFLLTNKIKKTKTSLRETYIFYRTRKDKFFMGVCGGIAKYIEIDSSSIRIIILLLTGLTLGLFSIAYLVIGLSSPQEPQIVPLANE